MRPDEIGGFARLAYGLKRFLRTRLAMDGAADVVRAGVATRSQRFLRNLNAVVFNNAQSPYRILCGWAGIGFRDVEALVREGGLEAALATLRDAGVYVEWEELKGRKPIVRGGRSLEVAWWMFNSPLSRADFEASTGGSSGRSLRVAVDLDNIAEAAPDWAALFHAYGWHRRPLLFWVPNHIGAASRFLQCSKFSMDMARWYIMARMTDPAEKLRSAAIHGLIRLVAGYPKPLHVPLTEPERVLDDLYAYLDEGRRPVMNTSPSAAAALGRLAVERGRPLEGVSFLLGAEPVTSARYRAIAEAGAQPVATYGTTEAGWIGARYPGPGHDDEVHLFTNAFAVIANSWREVDGGNGDALLFTSLRAAPPKVLLNAEIGDSAVIIKDTEDHWARQLGYSTRLHTIRSYRKVTVWGVTLAVADLGNILEDYLPRRFGGGHADYQLQEVEDAHGRPSVRLLIDPAVGPLDEQQVRDSFLNQVAGCAPTYGFMVEEIRSMNSLTIERRRPELTARGKLLPVVTKQGP